VSTVQWGFQIGVLSISSVNCFGDVSMRHNRRCIVAIGKVTGWLVGTDAHPADNNPIHWNHAICHGHDSLRRIVALTQLQIRPDLPEARILQVKV
jgi:hypothetical protein